MHLRVIEQSINDELEDLGMAPIYIENWTNDERVFINVKVSISSMSRFLCLPS